MKVQIDNNGVSETYVIKWKHEYPLAVEELTEQVKANLISMGEEDSILPGRIFYVPNEIKYGGTDCFIKLNNHVLTEGHTKCSKNDRFNKKIGREISLKRALDYDIYSKEFKTKVWEIYKKEIKHL